MITKKQKAEWQAALRSGQYKQGKRVLYNADTDRYCCLGVLGKLCGYNEYKLQGATVDYDLVAQHIQWKLVDKNDGNGIRERTFPEIADWIEDNVPTAEEST